ncbi:hypothetical protein JMN32_08150 [Fulvivirga sp. 29W222]|uniref:Secreted protein (Por secretion system target) n=1 Tax=Fulvivirga marina TaxID=2494733 RepID=A0A937G0J2_9BACT|nr:hypothetical protein [Fulvivirga marina]MBL6446276.1 hypothetical protein [Fulvivirga marina]
MKTLKKSMVAVLFLTTLFVSAYGSTPYIKVTSYDLKKFFVIIKNTDSSKVNVVLKDGNNFSLYKETYINSDEYLKGFDLQSLPDGEYTLEIENNQRIEMFALSIINNKLSINKDSRLVIHKPSINQNGNKVDVALQKLQEAPLKLSILDNTNDIIFEDTLADNGNLTKRYDMSRLGPGSYTMRIDIAGKLFSQSIRIQ